MEPKNTPFVSVIIPVYNDAERLRLCLSVLEEQTYPQNFYEVIVVDNASDKKQNTQEVVAQFAQAIVTYETTPGSYAARNQGLTQAKGEIIAFTDADCLPNSDWIEKGVAKLLQIHNCGLVAGKIEIFFENPDQPTAVELYESVTAFAQEKFLAEYHGAATGNLFTFRNIWDCVGEFDATLKSFGDLEWGSRVYQQGFEQVYDASVCVLHPARKSWQELYTRTIRIAAGNFQRLSQQKTSVLSKYIFFLGYLRHNIAPPLIPIIEMWQEENLKGVRTKLKVALVILFVRYVTALEILRIQLGKESERS